MVRITDISHQTISAWLTIEATRPYHLLKKCMCLVKIVFIYSQALAFFLIRLLSHLGHNHKEKQNQADNMKCCFG